MKKLLLLAISLFAGLGLYAQSGNSIPNSGFENWTVLPYQEPIGYQSSDDGHDGNNNGVPTVNEFRVTDAYHGSYAIQLKSVKAGTDTVAAYVACGNPGGGGPSGGIPMGGGTPTGIRLYYKYTKKAPDTALVIAEFKKSGSIIGQYFFSIYDTTSTYTLFTQIFSPALSATPDTVVFAAASSIRVMYNHNGNSSGYAPGSIFQIDSVSFTGIATQPTALNGDFENWRNDSSITILGWNNWMGSDSGNARRTTDAESGKYAVQLTTGPCGGCGSGGSSSADATGITSGQVSQHSGPHGGLPYTMTKDTLEFYYKYTPSIGNPNDTGLVTLILHNSSGGAYQQYNIYLKSTGGSYVKEDFPFGNFGFTPDSVLINIQSSYSMINCCNIPTSDIGSTLKVDNFRFLSQLPVSVTPLNPSYCSGGSVMLTASGATTYTWAPSTGLSATTGATVKASPFGTTTYTVTGTTGTTSGTQKVVVVVNNPPTVTISPSAPSICKGNSVNLTASGTSVSYMWSPGKGLNDSVTAAVVATPTATTNYTVTGTSAAGCTGLSTVNVKVNPSPTAGFTYGPVCTGQSTSFTNKSTGGSTYTWKFGDGGSSTLQNPTHIFANPGNYSVTLIVANANGCIDSVVNALTVDPVMKVTVTSTNVTCNGACNGTGTVNVSGGTPAYSYLWGCNGGTVGTMTGLCPGSCTITVTDVEGCNATGTVTITQPSALTVTTSASNTTCGQSNGSANAIPAGGTPPYTYSWNSTPVQTTAVATGLAAGTYSVIITDANNCTATGTILIAASSAPSISIKVTPSNCGSHNGIATASVSGGTSPYKYSWNNGDTIPKADSLGAGVYILTVTDKNGCSSFKAVTVSDTNGPVITASTVVNNKCSGQSNGSISIVVTGGKTPYKYSWSNGATTTSINNLAAGPYQVTVTDAAGCSIVKSITITSPAAISLTTSTTQASCGVSDGSASVMAKGGTMPYVYLWNNGAITTTISNVGAGTYSVTVTDNNGCSGSAVASVSNASGPVVTITSVVNNSCTAGTTGAISISDSGGTSPYTYMWSNGLTSSNISGLSAGNYNVTVTDVNGCKGTANATVTEVQPPTPSICMVTVDPSTNYNTIVWNKTSTRKIASYNIYKETTAPGIFSKIGNLRADTTGIFIDKLSNALIQSWRYEISEVDSCGNESSLSLPHKTMHLTINVGVGGAINLIWDNYQGLAFGHYIVYRDSVAGQANDSIGYVLNNGVFTYTNYPPSFSHAWFYHMGIDNPGGCNPAIEAINYNASKSNTGNVTVSGIPSVDVEVNSFEVYPNPTTGIFNMNVSLANLKQNVSVRILNTMGQVLSTENYNDVSGNLKKQLDLSAYSKGVYLIQIVTGNGAMYRKVIVQ